MNLTPTPAYWEYLWKTTKWFIGNCLFGLTPIIFMLGIYMITDHKIGGTQIYDLVHEGVILFVLAAIMGSILLDYFLAGYQFSGWEIFHIFIVPLIVIGVLCLNYLFICLTILNEKRFELTSVTSTFCYVVSIAYCFLQKTNLYMREDVTKIIKHTKEE